MTPGRTRKSYLLGALCVLGLALALGLGAAAAQADDNHPVVILESSSGQITIELDREKAPATVDNFLKYVDEKFYDNLIFHRVIRGFMIQGGGMDADLKERQKGVHAPIRNESGNGLSNLRGTIAMARTSDPNSATCQFYINHKDNLFLNGDTPGTGYAVFGKVTEGMDVVDKIANVATNRRDVPTETITIKSVRRKTKN
jgi:cyclophilin family peptidyl-prolyl cis-trans isomerase